MSHVGLIGCGAWGANILRDLLSLGAVVGVADPAADRRAAALDRGAAEAVADPAALAPVAGYVVAVPATLHAPVVEALLPTGRPIFVEKPLTTDSGSAQRIAAAAGDRVFVMDKWRYHPGIVAIGELLRAGTLGRPLAIRTQRLGWGDPHPDCDPVWSLLSHDLAIVQHWLGALPPLARVIATQPDRPAAGAIVQLGGGGAPLATIEFSSVAASHRRTQSLVGSLGSVDLGDAYATGFALRLGSPGVPTERREVACDGPLPLAAELRRFLAFLDGGPPPLSAAADGVAVVAMIEAVAARLAAGPA